jgi:hypothetical protein
MHEHRSPSANKHPKGLGGGLDGGPDTHYNSSDKHRHFSADTIRKIGRERVCCERSNILLQAFSRVKPLREKKPLTWIALNKPSVPPLGWWK